MYIADTANNRVQEVAQAAGTFWGVTRPGRTTCTPSPGPPPARPGTPGTAAPAPSALLNAPGAVTLDGPGNLYIADTSNNPIREVTKPPDISPRYAGNGQDLATAGDGGPAVNGRPDQARRGVADSHGDIYIADAANNRVQEIAAYSHTQCGIAMTGGDVYTVAGQGTRPGRQRAATAARPSTRTCPTRRASPSTPPATCSSPTPATTGPGCRRQQRHALRPVHDRRRHLHHRRQRHRRRRQLRRRRPGHVARC